MRNATLSPTSNDANENLIHGNSFTRADAFLGYDFGRNARLKFIRNLSVQLNVHNVFDKHDPLILNVVSANVTLLSLSCVRPQEPRYWRLSTDFSF